MKMTVKLRRDKSEICSKGNPILKLKEVAWETDTNKYKVGDGLSHWNDLPYEPTAIPEIFKEFTLYGGCDKDYGTFNTDVPEKVSLIETVKNLFS